MECYSVAAPNISLNLSKFLNGEGRGILSFGTLATTTKINIYLISGLLSVISFVFSFLGLAWGETSSYLQMGLTRSVISNDIDLIDAIHCIADGKFTDQIFLSTMMTFITRKISKRSLIIEKKITINLFLFLFTIVSRLLAFCLFAMGYGWLIWALCLIIHFGHNFIWHWNENYDFANTLILSLLHLFSYLPPAKKESDRKKHPRFPHFQYIFVS